MKVPKGKLSNWCFGKVFLFFFLSLSASLSPLHPSHPKSVIKKREIEKKKREMQERGMKTPEGQRTIRVNYLRRIERYNRENILVTPERLPRRIEFRNIASVARRLF